MKKIFLLCVFVVFFLFSQHNLYAHAFYRLTGILDIQKDNLVSFNTEDERLYNLNISKHLAKKHDGNLVQIDAYAQDGLNLETLTVKRIRSYQKRILPSEVPYDESRKFPKILEAKDSIYTIKNIRWTTIPNEKGDEHIWQTARIDINKVDKAYLVIKPFPPEWLAAHCLMLFTFEDGGFIDKDGNKSKGLVLSIEGYLRTDQKYSLVSGLRNKFGIIWLLATWENYSTISCNNSKGKLIAHEIYFDKQNTKSLLKEALTQANKDRLYEFYHTTRNNCTNNLVLMLNLFADKKIKPWTIPNMIYNVRATMPVIVPKRLHKLGIVSQPLIEVNSTNFFASPQELFKSPQKK